MRGLILTCLVLVALGLSGCGGGGGGGGGPVGPFDVTGTWSIYVNANAAPLAFGWTKASAQDVKLRHNQDTGAVEVLFPVSGTAPGNVAVNTGIGSFTVNYGGTPYDLDISMTGQDSFTGFILFVDAAIPGGSVDVPVVGTRIDHTETGPAVQPIGSGTRSITDLGRADWAAEDVIITDRFGVTDAAAKDDIESLSMVKDATYLYLLVKFEGSPGGRADRECSVTFFKDAGYPKVGDYFVHVDLDEASPVSRVYKYGAGSTLEEKGTGEVYFASDKDFIEIKVPLASLPTGTCFTRATIFDPPPPAFPTNPEKDGTAYTLVDPLAP